MLRCCGDVLLTRLRRVVSQVDAATLNLAARQAGLLPVLHDVTEGEAQVLLDAAQHELLGVKVDERVEQHVRRVRAQLLRLPQVLLLDPTHDQTCTKSHTCNKLPADLYAFTKHLHTLIHFDCIMV